MFEKVELFGGAIRGSKICLIIDLILVIHFIIYWYFNYRKWGWKMDFWTLITARLFMVHVLIMYPFNGSFLNISMFNVREFKIMDRFLDLAYLISITGYLSLYIGRFLYSIREKHIYLDYTFRPFQEMVEKNIKNRNTFFLITSIAFIFLFIVIYVQISTDNLFSPRTYFQKNGLIRPFYNLCQIFYPLAILYSGIRLIHKPSFGKRMVFFVLVIFSIFLGTRIAVLEPLLLVFVFYCIKNNRKIQIRKIALIGIVFIYSTILVLALRSDEVKGVVSTNAAKAILYGNTFSDTRDFAYLLSKWDHEYLMGRTYFAGLISFIPREFSEIRDYWALGKFTARITNYDSSTFPGFRPGVFGEAFFNFGWIGVILLGIMSGYVLRHVDLKIKESQVVHHDIVRGYSQMIPWTVVACFSISITITALYVFLGINFILYFIRSFIAFFNYYSKDKHVPV